MRKLFLVNKFDDFYLDMAERTALLSHANRKKVGAIIVKDSNILAYGYNGTPSGADNCCEYPILDHGEELVTKQSVLHAESNALMKVAQSNESTKDSTLYVTLSPCFECSKLIIQSGIKKVIFIEKYRDQSSISFLEDNNVEVKQIER